MKKTVILLAFILLVFTSCMVIPFDPSGYIYLSNPTDQPVIVSSSDLNDGLSFRIAPYSTAKVKLGFASGDYIHVTLRSPYYRGETIIIGNVHSSYMPTFKLEPIYARFKIVNDMFSKTFSQFYAAEYYYDSIRILGKMFISDEAGNIYTYDGNGDIKRVTQQGLGYQNAGYIYVDSSIINRYCLIVGVAADSSKYHSMPTRDYRPGNTYVLYASNLVN